MFKKQLNVYYDGEQMYGTHAHTHTNLHHFVCHISIGLAEVYSQL